MTSGQQPSMTQSTTDPPAPTIRVDAPDDWLRIRVDAAHWQVDARRFVDLAAERGALTRQERRDLFELIETAVGTAQQVGTVLLLLKLTRDGAGHAFIGSLTLTLTNLAPRRASAAVLREVVAQSNTSTSRDLQLADGSLAVLTSFATSDHQLPNLFAATLDDGQVYVAQAYGPVGATSWLAIATSTVTRADQVDLGEQLAARLLASVRLSATVP